MNRNMRKQTRCVRKGHRWATRTRTGYEDGHPEFSFRHYRCVGHSVTQERQVCLRCGEASEWETVDDYCINSLSLPSEEARILRRDKVVWS